eukprot:Filipodium_phascolosomae@DN2717_c1_g1_i23.p1
MDLHVGEMETFLIRPLGGIPNNKKSQQLQQHLESSEDVFNSKASLIMTTFRSSVLLSWTLSVKLSPVNFTIFSFSRLSSLFSLESTILDVELSDYCSFHDVQ